MTADPNRLEAIFAAALAKASFEERAAYIDEACAGDVELRRRLEALLKAHDDAGSFLEGPAAGEGLTGDLLSGKRSDSDVGPPPAEGLGTRIGPYKLLQQIGEGGMGVVYMAEQQEPIRRMVALKIIKPGMDSAQVVARFEAERQALALMDHQNIARVFDGGTTSGEPGGVSPGRPYFVMELVKGIPITRFCDENRLTPRERLEFFVPVCQAVQHAHQKGVIHRDLKPTNVLVTLYDGKPVPKVIDFGVAKALHQKLTERTLFTAFGTVVGTLEYMSPEQAELNALDVDTRSDVYALGVLLYELLTGSPPLERGRLRRAAYTEVLRLIREEEPLRPSTRLSGSGAALVRISAQRKTEPAQLARLVRGELDWIVMKALEKDRGQRYETASSLARDIERYLHDEVVEAQPPTAGYRLRKFVRKHRTALTTAAMIVLLLVAGVAISGWQAVRAMRAEWQTTQERDRAIQSEQEARLLQTKAQLEEQKALKSAAEAKAMISFFKELTLEAQQYVEDGEKEGRNKRMDEAIAVIDSEKIRALFADYPLAEAEIREWTAAQAFPTEGEFAMNGLFTFKSMRSIIQVRGAEHWFIIRYDPYTARRHLERALELRSAHLGPNDVTTLETMRRLGKTISSIDAGKGLQVLRDVVARSNAKFGPDHDQTLRSLASLAAVTENPNDAVRLWQDVYSRTKAKWGSNSIEAVNRSDSLAAAFETAGRIEEALRQREESLRARRKLAASLNDPSVGYALLEVARLYHQMQDYARAEPLWREALPFFKDDESFLDNVLESLGWCLLHRGKPADAEPVLRESLAIREKERPDAWTTFNTKSLLGAALLGQKKYADAEPLLLAGYEGMEKAPGQNAAERQGRLIEDLERLVQLYEATGKKDKADAWRKKLEETKARAKEPKK